MATTTDPSDTAQTPWGPDATRSARGKESVWRRALGWLYAREQPPQGISQRRVGLLVMLAIALAYAIVLSVYVVLRHLTFHTGGEDLGIIDQALWSTTHGQIMRETICNPITDTNCLAGTMRFAIHFEPILFLLAPLYLIVPHVEILLVIQVLAVAIGALGAYLLGAQRLGHVAWGLLFGCLFLVTPGIIGALPADFHPEVLAAAALMWAMYFLVTRRDGWLVACCVLALMCKETLSVQVIMVGAFVLIVQRRPRLGALLVSMGVATFGLALLLMHLSSPLGQSPVAGRLTTFVQDPLGMLLLLASSTARQGYLSGLFDATGLLALFSPWTWMIAAPVMLINVVSSDPNMYNLGTGQYNVTIAPVLIAAAIGTLVWLIPLLARARAFVLRAAKRDNPPTAMTRTRRAMAGGLRILPLAAVLVGAGMSLSNDATEFTLTGGWPAINHHAVIGESLLAEIPPAASVSAQDSLVPHLSQRVDIYQYPSHVYEAQYVFLDVDTSVDHPYYTADEYAFAVQLTLASGHFTLVDAQDGFVLLRRAAAGEREAAIHLPPRFYSYLNDPTSVTDSGAAFAVLQGVSPASPPPATHGLAKSGR